MMNIPIELFILIFLAVYFIIGFSQIFTGLRMKRETNRIHFRKKDLFVSVIIPIKEASGITSQHFESACKQDYPSYEVLFVAESMKDPAYKIAAMFAQRYHNTKVLISGQHDPSRTIGKCHNLAYAVKHAKGDVFLFGDSDVTYPQDWITKMTSPLQERAEGRQIDVVTSPFFIEPEGFLGKFIALSVSLITFTASFTNENHRFPSYASGASIAVTKRLFEYLGIAEIWENIFNDDLVLADEVIDNGHHIYNQLDNLNHPNEVFLNLRQTKEKLIRWVVTISTFGHSKLRAEVPFMVAKNLQFQISLIVGVALYLLGFPVILVIMIVIAGYIYLIAYRWLVGKIIEERGLDAYYILAPISVTAIILFFLLVRIFYRNFSWEGKTYVVKGRYSR